MLRLQPGRILSFIKSRNCSTRKYQANKCTFLQYLMPSASSVTHRASSVAFRRIDKRSNTHFIIQATDILQLRLVFGQDLRLCLHQRRVTLLALVHLSENKEWMPAAVMQRVSHPCRGRAPPLPHTHWVMVCRQKEWQRLRKGN